MLGILLDVPDLESIAAASVALALWKHIEFPDLCDAVSKMYSCNIGNNRSDRKIPGHISIRNHEDFFKRLKARKIVGDKLISDVAALMDTVSIPKSIVGLIKPFVRKIFDETDRWINYHHRTIFYDADYEYCLIPYFSYFVWCPNGVINYRQTALNLQNSNSDLLSDSDKFRLLCLYCLKDEIEQKWKLVENQVFNNVTFHFHPLLHYWVYYCRNEMSKIPVIEGVSIDTMMFQHDYVDNWSAKEYFFDRMTDEEQYENAKRIIRKPAWFDCEKFEMLKPMIMKLDPSQQRVLYERESVYILIYYAMYASYCNIELPLWVGWLKFCREDFVYAMKAICEYKVKPHVIAEIWNNVPDSLKLKVLRNADEELVAKLWNWWTTYRDDDMFRTLRDLNTDIREEIGTMKVFKAHCKSLLDENELPKLSRMLNLCFPNLDELASFKRTLAQHELFPKHCEILLVEKKASALEQLFNFFSSVIDLDVLRKDLVGRDFFNGHCVRLVKKGEIAELDDVLDLLFSKHDEIKKSIRDRSIGKGRAGLMISPLSREKET